MPLQRTATTRGSTGTTAANEEEHHLLNLDWATVKYVFGFLAATIFLPSFASAADVPCGPSKPCGPQPPQNSWVFRRSYYTHEPSIAAPTGGNYVARGPVYTRPEGEYVRGSYRSSYSMIRVNGQIWDRTWQWDSWVQHGSQR